MPTNARSSILEHGAVHHRHVADHAILADDRRAAVRLGAGAFDMEDRSVLHVRARPDFDAVDVAAQHAVVPHAGLGPDGHVADDPRAGGDEGGIVDLRHLAFKRQDRRPRKALGGIHTAAHASRVRR
jgi:hypothetical protein